jgi:ABC-type molybdenum transport system ATPase subunit/photorepair protein PhrA
MRSFHEDSLVLTLDDRTVELCRQFDIVDKLDLRPGQLHQRDLKNTIIVREIAKHPLVLALERPEDFIDHADYRFFKETLTAMMRPHPTLVFYSSDPDFIRLFSNKRIKISKGRLLI